VNTANRKNSFFRNGLRGNKHCILFQREIIVTQTNGKCANRRVSQRRGSPQHSVPTVCRIHLQEYGRFERTHPLTVGQQGYFRIYETELNSVRAMCRIGFLERSRYVRCRDWLSAYRLFSFFAQRMIQPGAAYSFYRGMFSELRFIVQVKAKTVIVFVTELRGNDFEEFRVIDLADAVEI
jgi:hypothetical protein